MSKLAQRLADAARSGAYRAPGTAEIEDAARGTRIDLVQVDLRGADDKEQMLERMSRAVGFPAWFGGNWDALEDSLQDLSWRTGEAHVLLVRGFEELPADELGVLLDVLASSAAYWAARGRPFFAVLVDPERSLALPELFRPKAA